MPTADYAKYGTFEVTIDDRVATVKLLSREEGLATRPDADPHWELQLFMNQAREDHDIRVIVITGVKDGEFLLPPKLTRAHSESRGNKLADPAAAWEIMLGILRLHNTMAELEKPIVAKVNGDAIGFGQSIMFSCDLIVAREDALVGDAHLAQGTVTGGLEGAVLGSEVGVTPGDGAGATVPLYMSPTLAKEYLMLSRVLTGRELADRYAINYAVPMAELDSKVNGLVQELLSKNAFAIAWTKRLANRALVDQLHRSLDVGLGYQFVNMLQGSAMGFDNPTSLRH